MDSGKGSEEQWERPGIRVGKGECPRQVRPTWNMSQAKASIIGVGTGCLCHLDKGRPVEQGPSDEA